MASTSVMKDLLLENSTERFYIEHDWFQVNHISHGIVALSLLGADKPRIQQWCKWYSKRLEELPEGGQTYKEQITGLSGPVTEEQIKSLVSARKDFYVLVNYYERRLKEVHGGSIDSLITEKFLMLADGLATITNHALIHLGYAYAAKLPRLVVEGIAYLHHSYFAMNLPNVDITPACTTAPLFSVLAEVNADKPLLKFLQDGRTSAEWLEKEPHSPFKRAFNLLFLEKAAELSKYARRVKLPDMSCMTAAQRAKCLGRWLTDDAIMLYTASVPRNDFFFLHCVTSAWCLAQVLHLAPDEATMMRAVHTFLCAEIGMYLTQDTPVLKMEQLAAPEGKTMTWPQIVARALAIENVDEHIVKVLHICLELSDDCKDDAMQVTYKNAALCTMLGPFWLNFTLPGH